MRFLVTRPQPAADATARRLGDLGHGALVAPLMAIEALPWALPAPLPAAVMLTSAVAARLAGPGAVPLHGLPTFAVGAATARAAAAAGFGDVRDGGGTVQALLDAVAAAGFPVILHLAGEDRTSVVVPSGLIVITRTVYFAQLRPLSALPVVNWVLLYSPRSAAHFAAEVDRLGAARGDIAIAAISPAALAAAGPGWRDAVVAARPNEDALLAAIGISCQ